MSLFNAEIFFKNLLSWDYFLAALTTLSLRASRLYAGKTSAELSANLMLMRAVA